MGEASRVRAETGSVGVRLCQEKFTELHINIV